MRYTTANLMALPFNRDYKHGIDSVCDASDMVGWQEFTRLEYLTHLVMKPGWADVGHPSALIAYRHRDWELVDSGSELLHPATKDVCTERRITWARFSRVGARDRQVIVTNRHYVARAFSHKPEADKPLRKAMWETGNSKDLTLLRELVDTGLPVVCMADGNRLNYNLWGTAVRGKTLAYAPGGGLDQLAFINGEHWHWKLAPADKLPIPGSDHDRRTRTGYLASIHDHLPGK